MVTPAPAVSWPAVRSTSESERRRSRLQTTSPRSGTAPPARPVLPPWTVRPDPWRRQAATTSATSTVEPGRTTAGVWPTKRPVQSVQ